MFITAEEVMEVTPYENVTIEEVRQAQFIIEMYVGRTESEINSPRDKSMLARATAAQTVYMRGNPDVTFDQIKVRAQTTGDGGQSFGDEYSPFIAPMAAMACQHLSWLGSRSVRVGRTNQRDGGYSPREMWVRD